VRYTSEGRSGFEGESVMVQRAMSGPELSVDCLGDLSGRCLNAIPRTMLESRAQECGRHDKTPRTPKIRGITRGTAVSVGVLPITKGSWCIRSTT